MYNVYFFTISIKIKYKKLHKTKVTAEINSFYFA
jgi:hypothetical protein